MYNEIKERAPCSCKGVLFYHVIALLVSVNMFSYDSALINHEFFCKKYFS